MLYTFKTHTRTQAHTHKGWNMHAIILEIIPQRDYL